ncbi:MAG: pseudaminic acid synthase [Actinomycetota bacterium]
MESFKIGGRLIGPGNTAYVIAEISANHLGDYGHAERLVHEAAAAGADAVKLQTYTADTITIDVDSPLFKDRTTGTLWEGRGLYDLYKEGSMPWEWQPKLKAVADDLGIALFSAPFDFSAVDFLEEMDVPAYKVASFEIVDLPLIEKMAATGKPIIISTGMSTKDEIEEAIGAARGAGAKMIALLKCVSAYPAPPSEMNLASIPVMRSDFGVPVGLSDHTLGIAAPVAAVALGACIIEKHFTLSRSEGGPDGAFSLEPSELKTMIESIRVAEQSIGESSYGPGTTESGSRVFRRSLFIVSDVKAGELLTERNVRSIRPGDGLHPRHYKEVLGRKAAQDIKRGTPLSWEIIEPPM